MSEVPKTKLSVDEFLAWAWAEAQPGRHELVNGRVVARAPERARHAEAKGAAYVALLRAVEKAGVGCHVFPDGMTVRIDATTAYEPDALVRCGRPLDGEAIEVPDPMIVVEVLSPGTRSVDTGAKLTGYFMVPSLAHYLIVDPDRRLVVHHRREAGDAIATRIVGFGALCLEPPGIALPIGAMVGSAVLGGSSSD